MTTEKCKSTNRLLRSFPSHHFKQNSYLADGTTGLCIQNPHPQVISSL